jgi:hypothetical protein
VSPNGKLCGSPCPVTPQTTSVIQGEPRPVWTDQRRPLINGAALVFGLAKPMLAHPLEYWKSMNSL